MKSLHDERKEMATINGERRMKHALMSRIALMSKNIRKTDLILKGR